MRFSFQDRFLLRTLADSSPPASGPADPQRLTRCASTPGGAIPRFPAHHRGGGWRDRRDGDARCRRVGQTLFDFDTEELSRKVAPIARQAFRAAQRGAEETTADGWYSLGCQLETGSPEQAREAYERAIGADPGHADARVNLGRLLHEGGDAAAAADHYRAALSARPDDTTAAFNLGVALEDMGKPRSALDAYEKAVSLDPENADAHFNAASLCERLGRPAAALRHLKVYRNLVRERFS